MKHTPQKYLFLLVNVALFFFPSLALGSSDDDFHIGVFGGYRDLWGLGNAGGGVEFVLSSRYSLRCAAYLGENTTQNWTGKSLSVLYHPMRGSFYVELGSALATRRNRVTSCDLAGTNIDPNMRCGSATNESDSIDGKIAIGNKWKIFNTLTLGGEWQGLYYPIKILRRTENKYDRELTSGDKEKLDSEFQKEEESPAIFHIYLLLGFEY